VFGSFIRFRNAGKTLAYIRTSAATPESIERWNRRAYEGCSIFCCRHRSWDSSKRVSCLRKSAQRNRIDNLHLTSADFPTIHKFRPMS
jgi:hypothetical protein